MALVSFYFHSFGNTRLFLLFKIVPLVLIRHMSPRSNTIGSRRAGQLVGSLLRDELAVYHYGAHVT